MSFLAADFTFVEIDVDVVLFRV